MALPQPSVPLTDACSVIFNNTLYTYSNAAFQALPLTPGARWKQLPPGEPVTGGVCVGSTPGDPNRAGFWVVGGAGKTAGYNGLQQFTFSTGKWASITPSALVTQDRLWHNAVYLNGSDTILMYAGNQDGSQHLSSQTFTIQASAPYNVLSYQSIAPPTTSPILLQWSDTQAVLLGGSDLNTQVMLFDPQTGWTDSGTTLAAPLPKNTTEVKAVLEKGDDGCKNIYTFDMSVTPNQVNRTVLLDGAGHPVQKSAPVSRRSPSGAGPLSGRAGRRRRQAKSLTLDDWPRYDPTLAPNVTRTSYALAQDPDGLVVIAGGSTNDVLCMFDGRKNGWVNATAHLVDASTSSSAPSSSPSSVTPTSSASSGSSAATSSPPPVAIASNQQSPTLTANTILGIVLGTMAGFAVLLVLIYILVRRRRRHQDFADVAHHRRASGAASPEKGGFGFASDSLPQGPAKGTFRGHQPQDSHTSFSSMTILMGRVNQQNKSGSIQRNNSKESRSSEDSVFNKAFKSTISKPIPQSPRSDAATTPPPPFEARGERGVSFGPDVADPRPRAAGPAVDRQGSTRRSSGWNRYWSDGSALNNILGFSGSNGGGGGGGGGGTNGGKVDSRRVTVESDRSSQYSSDQHRITQDSATVPPLHVVAAAATAMPPSSQPRFQRVNSGSPTMAAYDSRIKDEMRAQIERSNSHASSGSAYSSGIPASVHDTWDPTAMSTRPWGAARAPAGAYAAGATNFSTPLPPSSSGSGASGRQPQLPTGVSRQPQLSHAATSSDMSWLNLGDFSRS